MFKVTYVKAGAKSYDIPVLFYTVTVPDSQSGALIEAIGPKQC